MCCVSVSAGWSDGAERDSQIQEEIRHLSALQADLNLNSGAPQCFLESSVLTFCWGFFFCIITFSQILHWDKFTASWKASGFDCGLGFKRPHFCLHRALIKSSRVCAGCQREMRTILWLLPATSTDRDVLTHCVYSSVCRTLWTYACPCVKWDFLVWRCLECYWCGWCRHVLAEPVESSFELIDLIAYMGEVHAE